MDKPFIAILTSLGSTSWDWLYTLRDIELLLQGVLVFVLLLLGRYIYDWVTPFSLAEVLTTRDNKALSASFACYLLGLAIVISGVYSSNPDSSQKLPQAYYEEIQSRSSGDASVSSSIEGDSISSSSSSGKDSSASSSSSSGKDGSASSSISFHTSSSYAAQEKSLWSSLGDTFFWGLIGICLLLLAQILNNRLILSHFDNYLQIINKSNIAVGITEGASYVSSAILLYGVMQGAHNSFLLDIFLTLVYFILGQLALVVYSKVYIALRRRTWQVHTELAGKNPAAAISFAFSLLSFSLLLGAYIANFDSLYGLFLAFVLDIILLGFLHFLIDKLFFPKVSLAVEIARDQNWGAALIEGFLLLGICTVFVIAFHSYLP